MEAATVAARGALGVMQRSVGTSSASGSVIAAANRGHSVALGWGFGGGARFANRDLRVGESVGLALKGASMRGASGGRIPLIGGAVSSPLAV